jgi:GxxExxY protein
LLAVKVLHHERRMAIFRRSRINRITSKIIGAAIEVHRQLGPGLLESIYQRCLRRELSTLNLAFEVEKTVDVNYKGESLDSGLKLDFFVQDLVIVELKAVEALAPIHEAQVLTYLKLTGAPIGLLINFNVRVLREGIQRILNKQHELVDDCNPIERQRLKDAGIEWTDIGT